VLMSRTYQYTNGLRKPDGTTPRRSEYSALAANASASLTPLSPNEQLAAARSNLTAFVAAESQYRNASNNLFKAHKQAIGG